jgi:putative solute:sodium symporter small subunit
MKREPENMIESDHRSRHWQGTKTNALISIVVLVVILLLASLFSGLFSGWTFLGFPFSFFYAAEGAFILMIILVFWSSGRQEKTDRRHGASEEI